MYMINLNQFFPRLNNQITNKFVPKIEGDGWIYGDLHISSPTQPEVEKFVDTKIRLQQILHNLSISHPKVLVESNIDTIDSLIYNIYKFPLTINDLADMLLK